MSSERDVVEPAISYQTGDLILFHGTGNLFSWFVEFFTGSQYSHIGIILKNPKFQGVELEPAEDGLYLWQSGISEYTDAEDNEMKLGVQISPLYKELKNYQGTLYYRKLSLSSDLILDDKKLSEIHSVVHNRPYDLNPKDWVEAFFEKNKGDLKTEKRFWCSALVAYVYIKLGLLPADLNWSFVIPEYFAQIDKLDKGCSLGKIEKVTF